jgi:hypothetical protein
MGPDYEPGKVLRSLPTAEELLEMGSFETDGWSGPLRSRTYPGTIQVSSSIVECLAENWRQMLPGVMLGDGKCDAVALSLGLNTSIEVSNRDLLQIVRTMISEGHSSTRLASSCTVRSFPVDPDSTYG